MIDFYLHFFVSLILYAIFIRFNMTSFLAIVATLLVGVIKEVVDPVFSWSDISADFAGVVFGFLIFTFMPLLFKDDQ